MALSFIPVLLRLRKSLFYNCKGGRRATVAGTDDENSDAQLPSAIALERHSMRGSISRADQQSRLTKGLTQSEFGYGDDGDAGAVPYESWGQKAKRLWRLSRLRRGIRFLRGHFWRRVRAVSQRIELKVKLRMALAHLQFVALLPNTFLLNVLHGVPEPSVIFPSERKGNWLLDLWAIGNAACRFSADEGRGKIVGYALEGSLPLALCLFWYLFGLLHGALTVEKGKKRLHFARVKRLSWLFAACAASSDASATDGAGEHSPSAAAAAAASADQAKGKMNRRVTMGTVVMAAQKVKQKPWWQRCLERWRRQGLPLILFPYNASSTAMLRPIIMMIWIASPFLSQRAFDIIFSQCFRAGESWANSSYLEAWPEVKCQVSPQGLGSTWKPVDKAGEELKRIATIQAVLYAGAVPLFFLAVLFANDQHIRDGSNTHNSRAIRWLTRGYRAERDRDRLDAEKQAHALHIERKEKSILRSVYRCLMPVRDLLAELLARLRLDWEVLEYLKLISITSFSCAISRGTSFQALISLLFVLCHLALCLFVKPLSQSSNRTFLAFCHLVQAWTLVICLLLHLQASGDGAFDGIDDGIEETAYMGSREGPYMGSREDPVLAMLSNPTGHEVLQRLFDLSLLVNFLLLAATTTSGILFDEQPMRTLQWLARNREVQRNDLPAIRKNERWHLFLSHCWADGQDQTHGIHDHLRDMLPGLKCFLDIESNDDIGQLEEYVHQSKVFFLLLSPQYLWRYNCVRELMTAVEAEMPIVCVVDIDKAGVLSLHSLICSLKAWKDKVRSFQDLPAFHNKGSSAKEALITRCAERLEEVLRGEEDPEQGPIPYDKLSRSSAEFKKVTLRLIGQQVFQRLRDTEDNMESGKGKLRGEDMLNERLCLPHEEDEKAVAPHPLSSLSESHHHHHAAAHVYVSSSNPQAKEVLKTILTRPNACAGRAELGETSATASEPIRSSANLQLEGERCLTVKNVQELAMERRKTMAASGPTHHHQQQQQQGQQQPLEDEPLLYTHSRDENAEFDNADHLFVYLTKKFLKEASEQAKEFKFGVDKDNAASRLRDLLQDVEDFLDSERSPDGVIAFYEADASSALVEQKEGPEGSTFDEVLSYWNEFDKYYRLLPLAHRVKAKFKAKAKADDEKAEPSSRRHTFSDAQAGQMPRKLMAGWHVEGYGWRKIMFHPLYSDHHHPHHRITVKLLAKALCAERQSDTVVGFCDSVCGSCGWLTHEAVDSGLVGEAKRRKRTRERRSKRSGRPQSAAEESLDGGTTGDIELADSAILLDGSAARSDHEEADGAELPREEDEDDDDEDDDDEGIDDELLTVRRSRLEDAELHSSGSAILPEDEDEEEDEEEDSNAAAASATFHSIISPSQYLREQG